MQNYALARKDALITIFVIKFLEKPEGNHFKVAGL